MFAHLHIRSWFSFQAGGSSPEALAERAAALGFSALAITDVAGMYGAVRFQKACEAHGITPVFGAEVPVIYQEMEEEPAGKNEIANQHYLVLLARSRRGYRTLCSLLTMLHASAGSLSIDTLSDYHNRTKHHPSLDELHCLTGATGSYLYHLIDRRAGRTAKKWVHELQQLFGARLSLEATHLLRRGDGQRLRRLRDLSEYTGVPLVATGDVRHATRKDYARYDLLTCIRQGHEVYRGAPGRPTNAEAHLKSEKDLRQLFNRHGNFDDAFDRAAHIAADCSGVDLLPGAVCPPAPQTDNPDQTLIHRCRQALRTHYPSRPKRARRQLERELNVITDLGFSGFFLVVAEVVDEAKRRGIRCAGRGSAANSIVAYLLGITRVDPIEHNLLFERFLHHGRTGTPDIDIDFGSERRDEIIGWMEQRFGTDHTAMTATLVMYRLRSALRDVGKALGFAKQDIDTLAKRLPRRDADHIGRYRNEVRDVLGDTPLTHALMRSIKGLAGCPRHLGLHSGGMVLAREPLDHFSPVQRSASGVAQVQFDKHDVEALGLVKLDVLGLRMLSTISEAESLIRRYEDPDFDIDHLPEDDIKTFNMMRAGHTIGCFQIESQGQMHLLAKHQPECFGDLITEIALFRPGPLQGGMVSPFVRRRQGQEPVTYEHPSLKPILYDTYGVILFQEQVLEVAHQFAGMSLKEADTFRRLMSSFRDPGAMENMREQFVAGATGKGVSERVAHRVFDQIAGFVGYGFCRSHAAAFAQTVYQSAYLKRHHPAAFMAALMQHRPGMYDQLTLEEEARRFSVRTLPPCIQRSGMRFRLEPARESHAIRKPLTAVNHVSEEHARTIALERLNDPFADLEDFYRRVELPMDTREALARAGALHILEEQRRTALWKLGVLKRRLNHPDHAPTLFDVPGKKRHHIFSRADQSDTLQPQDIPPLPVMEAAETYSWDLELHGASAQHPVTLLRRELASLEIRPIETCYQFGRRVKARGPKDAFCLRVAGRVMLRQKPPTANGMMFVTLEDETGHIQCVVSPDVQERQPEPLRQPALIAYGRVEVDGNWRGLMVERVWPLRPLLGGYEGFPSSSGGMERKKTSVSSHR